MKQFQFIEWDDEGTTATLWLNRPPVNAIVSEMYVEIRELCSATSPRTFPRPGRSC